MRTAIAMFGIPRGSNITMPTIHRHFIEPACRLGECKVFYHLYEQDRVTNARSGEDGQLPRDAYAPFAAFDGELEAPGACLARWNFDRIQQFGDEYDDGFGSIRNLIHQLHSLRQVTQRVAQWRPDVVLFLRPDLYYHGGLSDSTLRRLAARRQRCTIPEWQWWDGYNDRFSICSADAFSAYGNRVELMVEFSERTGRPLHAERLVRYALEKARISVRTTTLRASRVRIDGQTKPEYFSATSTVGSGRRKKMELAWVRLLSRTGL